MHLKNALQLLACLSTANDTVIARECGCYNTFLTVQFWFQILLEAITESANLQVRLKLNDAFCYPRSPHREIQKDGVLFIMRGFRVS